MDRLLKSENKKLHRRIAKLEVENLSQRGCISALEKQLKKLSPPSQPRERESVVEMLRKSPALTKSVKRALEQAAQSSRGG